jgi:WD40 repeat protein
MSSFFVTGGSLRFDAPSYIERAADRLLYQALLASEFCYVLTSRQMGKSSLMIRTANRLRGVGVNVAVLDLTAIGQNVSPEQWYYGLLFRTAEELGLEDQLDTYWDKNVHLGPCQRFFSALRYVALEAQPQTSIKSPTPGWAVEDGDRRRLVVFVDEIDVVRSVTFPTDEFFAAIRECYNRRTEDLEFCRLTFCLLGVATPSDLIRDTRLTPFNIGRRIELTDFSAEEAATLAGGLQSPDRPGPHASRVLDRVLFWTGGHPYLTQRLCQSLLGREDVKPAFVDSTCTELFFTPRATERDDNLSFVRERLLRNNGDMTALLTLYNGVLRGKRVPDDDTNPLVSILRLSGIVRTEEGYLVERNAIYKRVFDDNWINSHMPDAEMRRQRAAFYRGVVRTTAVAAIVIAFLIALAVYALDERNKARQALAQSYFSQARAKRVSGLAGQRYEALAALEQAKDRVNGPQLRDEVIAALTLFDLRPAANGAEALVQSNVGDTDFDRSVVATIEAEGTITLRNLKDGKPVSALPPTATPATRVRFSPYGRFLAAEYRGEPTPQTVLWDWENRVKLFSVPGAFHAEAVAFSADNRKLALGHENGQVNVYSLPEGRVLSDLALELPSGLPRKPDVIRWSPSGDWLAEACSDDYNVQIWNWKTGERVLRLYHPAVTSDISWHPGGDLLATACQDDCVYLWRTNRTDSPFRKLIGHESDIAAVAFNKAGTLLATLAKDDTIRLWSPATERHVTCRLDGESFDRLRFSDDDRRLLATRAGTAARRSWQVLGEEYRALEVRAGLADQLKNIDFSPDSRCLAAISGERITVWECTVASEMAVLGSPYTSGGWFSADSRRLFVSTGAGLRMCSVPCRSSNVTQRFSRVPEELGAMSLSSDRHDAAVVFHDKVLMLSLDAGTNAVAQTNNTTIHYHRIALHPEGLWLAAMTAGSDALHLWKSSEFGDSKNPVIVPSTEYFSFSPDGQWMGTCWAGQFQFYRVGEWDQPAFTIARQPPTNQHGPLAFAQQSGIVAIAASRHTIQLLRLSPEGAVKHSLLATLESPDRIPLEMLAFSPDGKWLAGGTAKLVVQLWNLAALRDGLARFYLHHGWPDYRQNLEPTPQKL